MVCGFHKPPSEWGQLDTSEKRNPGSAVIRAQYNGKSILLTGDTVGRHLDDPPKTCIAAEKFMIEMSEVVKIDSDVLIAPHHGADNGSSIDFIRAVSPEFVVFPAGHKYKDPRAQAAAPYIGLGVPKDRMFRTDRGDDEGGEEWDEGWIPGNHDPVDDDDVDILITKQGAVKVAYRNAE
ncbi:MAG: ComEC/Rec2 family competence protein [Planctomycetota bacterium]|jgi:competence protein ComEC